MALVTDRAGRVHLRVGGNTQETAVLVDSLPDGLAIEKDKADSSNPVCNHHYLCDVYIDGLSFID